MRCEVETNKDGFKITEQLEWSKGRRADELQRICDQRINECAITEDGILLLSDRGQEQIGSPQYRLFKITVDEKTGKPDVYSMGLSVAQFQYIQRCGKWPFPS